MSSDSHSGRCPFSWLPFCTFKERLGRGGEGDRGGEFARAVAIAWVKHGGGGKDCNGLRLTTPAFGGSVWESNECNIILQCSDGHAMEVVQKKMQNCKPPFSIPIHLHYPYPAQIKYSLHFFALAFVTCKVT